MFLYFYIDVQTSQDQVEIPTSAEKPPRMVSHPQKPRPEILRAANSRRQVAPIWGARQAGSRLPCTPRSLPPPSAMCAPPSSSVRVCPPPWSLVPHPDSIQRPRPISRPSVPGTYGRRLTMASPREIALPHQSDGSRLGRRPLPGHGSQRLARANPGQPAAAARAGCILHVRI